MMELALKRYAICKSCEFLNKTTYTCKKCRCFMKAKCAIKNAICPIKKWDSIILTTNQPKPAIPT